MAKKKRQMTSNERMAEHRQRMREMGYRQIAVQLPASAIARLDTLAKSNKQSRADVIAGFLLEPEPAAKNIVTSDTEPAPKPAKKKRTPARKKKSAVSASPETVDAIGLARPESFKDFPGAVSVRVSTRDRKTVDSKRQSILDWRDHPREFMAVWEAQKLIEKFKKNHPDYTTRYMDAEKTMIEFGAENHRIKLQARNR